MSGLKNLKEAEPIAAGSTLDSGIKLSGKDMAASKNGIPDAISSVPSTGDAASGIKKASGSEQGVYYPPTSYYDYCYPGYNGNFQQSDNKGYFNNTGSSYTGVQSDNGSLLYYLPGYSPYAPGYAGVDGTQPYASSDYLQQPVSYGSETFPMYTYDSSYAGNGSASTTAKTSQTRPVKSNGFNSAKTNTNIPSKSSTLPWSSRSQPPASSFSSPYYQSQPLKPLNKLGSGYQSAALMKGYQPVGKYSPFTNRNPGFYMHYGPVNYQSNGRAWNNNNYRYKSRENFSKNGEFEASTELTRGPRAENSKNSTKSLVEVDQPGQSIQREKYNLEDFQIQFENAKFFVIKSYSEDDIHKCIKYDVWSSTPNGNKKLNDAFKDADAKFSESGAKCPVFLFFSVNASGQFVGVAEMIGQVDFDKNMDFWQLDKWNGFFPVKWHIIKDVPNTQLRHIILENNDNRSVTYSRDTQEIGLKQGLEMLSIFKSYSEKTSVLDDFNFYENREKALKAKRGAKPAPKANEFELGDAEKHAKAGERSVGEISAKTNPTASLIALTENLSLNSHSLKSSI